MVTVIIILIGVVALVSGYSFAMRRARELEARYGGQDELNKNRERQREERVRKTLTLFNTQKKVANNDVERVLGVSDSTAESYLSALEMAGKIRQVGKSGRSVYYEKI